MPRIRKPKPKVQVLLPDYSDDAVDKILARISEGELLLKICQEPGAPTRAQFYNWMLTRPAMRDRYARARLAWADWHAESIVNLVTDPKGNYIENGNRLPLTHEEVGARRLHIDSVKWLVGKWAPRTYGDSPELPPEPEKHVTAITRTIVQPVTFRFEGDAPPAPGPPLQLTFDPGPLPERLDSEILARVIRAVKDNVPKADQCDPQEILEEAITTIARALKAKYASEREITLEERIDRRSLARSYT
jgi:hypothetical protein